MEITMLGGQAESLRDGDGGVGIHQARRPLRHAGRHRADRRRDRLEYHSLAVSDAVFQGNAAQYQAFYSLYQVATHGSLPFWAWSPIAWDRPDRVEEQLLCCPWASLSVR
ncbi:MAG: hypothetical protein R2851_09065 [Caldilineaceae bacterium]